MNSGALPTEANTDETSPFDERERTLGLFVLRLLIEWSKWVHRRVETIHFVSADTYRRQVSVDLTLPEALLSPLTSGDGQELHFAPLTLLKKRPLTNFDLRDEAGKAMPLLTKQRNGLLAGALLSGMASAVVSPPLKAEHGEHPPPDIERALLDLALSPGDQPKLGEQLLSPSAAESSASKAWRDALLDEPQFLEFGRMLALNYLVVVPLCGPSGTRRVLKLAYDEPPQSAAGISPRDNPVRRVARMGLGFVLGESFGPRARPRRRPGALRRGLGIRSEVRAIKVPAAGYGSSYHLELVAPEGLNITRGVLVPIRRGVAAKSAIRILAASRRRTQLYFPSGHGMRLGSSGGAALVHLRPTPATLVRASALLSFFTTLLLLFVALQWKSLAGSSGALPGLLLIVPAGLAALITRSGEDAVTTRLLWGIRLAAISAALCAYVAAALLVAGRSCHSALFGQTCESWAATPVILWGLVAISLVTTCALMVAWSFASLPPEQSLEPRSSVSPDSLR